MPSRIIKESIRGSEDLASVSAEAERLFWRLIVTADDFGRFDARPKTIIGQCLTAFLGMVTAKQVETWLNELEAAGLVNLYTVEDRPYLVLTKWDKHQRRRAKDSKFPPPDDSCGHLLSSDSKRGQSRTFAAYNENENVNENEFENGNENENENGESLTANHEVAASLESTDSSSSLDLQFGQVILLYESEGFGPLTKTVGDEIQILYDEYGPVWLTESLKESVMQNKRRLSYAKSILQNWRAEGGIRRTGGEGIEYRTHIRSGASPPRTNQDPEDASSYVQRLIDARER